MSNTSKINRRTVVAFVIITVAVLTAVLTGVGHSGTPDTSESPTTTVTAVSGGIPACTQEDGSGQDACYWDAERQGNGTGWSYVITDGGLYTTYITSLDDTCAALAQLPAMTYADKGAPQGFTRIPSGLEIVNQMIESETEAEDMRLDCAGWLSEFSQMVTVNGAEPIR